MKTVFDKATRIELVDRIAALEGSYAAQWGKMNAYQMVRHCSLFDEWVLGKNNPVYRQAFIGRLFGRIALKGLLKDESPMKRNMPTTSDLVVKETDGNFLSEKAKWIALIEDYENYSNPAFVHDFFGRMTTEQIGFLAFKHTDHHLRQFSA
ncbi:MAG TPA: DUF1569 domain-containing protein [Pyrinomonadaceae bacterium]|nr:DUF1569 domain-containing protein [Pyrinomonadaceae bacterium]